ncbi:MAG: DoxX family protein [Gemmatimonadales bacterium]
MRTRRNVFLLSILFIVAGLMHFVVPNRYMGIMPPWIPYQLEMVYVSGVAEFLGGVGLVLPRFRKTAGFGLILLLIAVFPANVQMLGNAMRDGGSLLYIALLFLRLPLQPLLIVWVYHAAIESHGEAMTQLPRTSL